MSHTEVVHVQLRESSGSIQARKLRAAGRTPAVLYGHGEDTVSLSIATDEIGALLRHGGRVVELQGAVSGNALVRAVQWDSCGSEVLHLDLTRVSTGEMVATTVPVKLRGTAPGTKQGGIVEHVLHELEIRCPVTTLPEELQVSINHLELGQTIHVSDLVLPEGARAVVDGSQVVVHCVLPAAEVEAAAVATEPELIGRRPAAEGEDNGEGEEE